MAQLITIESGVLEVTSDRDYTVPLQGSFSSPPLVLLTGEGLRSHSTACLIASAQHAITCTSFTARLIHQYSSSPGAWEKGRVHWVAISPSALGGVVPISTSGDSVISFNRPFGSHPAVIATGQGNSNHSTACLPNDSSVSTTSALLRLIDHLCAWETGMLHYFAADQPVLSSLVPGAKCGIVAITSNEDVRVELQGFTEPPVVLLCGAGNDGHSTACLLHDTVKADGFTARLITNQGCWNHGALHWMALPMGLQVENQLPTITATLDVSDQAAPPPPSASCSTSLAAASTKTQFRIVDVAVEDPNAQLGPISGVMKVERLDLKAAAAKTGVDGVTAHAYLAAETGTEWAATRNPHGLDADEIGAIVLYTRESDFYPTLNKLLRSRDREALKPFFPYLKLMLLAREKLPAYRASVWRGVKGLDLRASYPKGKEFYWWGFSSTTKQLETLTSDQFLGTAGVRTEFMIEVISGVDIEPYSEYQGDQTEAEVLLYPGTKFVVVGSMYHDSGLHQVHLRELSLPTDVQLLQ